MTELGLVKLLCSTFLLVLLLHNVLVVLYDVGHADVARDAHSRLIILDLLDERSAFDLRVARLHLTQVIRCSLLIHLSDLPLEELLCLSDVAINLVTRDWLVAWPVLYFLELVQNGLENVCCIDCQCLLILEPPLDADCLSAL